MLKRNAAELSAIGSDRCLLPS